MGNSKFRLRHQTESGWEGQSSQLVVQNMNNLQTSERREPFLLSLFKLLAIIVVSTPVVAIAVATITPGGKIFEAEDAVYNGAKVISGYGDGYSGSGYVDYQNASDDYIEWKLQIDQPGTYNISFVYALAKDNRPLELKVNGSVIKGKLAFPTSGSFSTWTETATVPVKLKVGINKIQLIAIGASGPNVDYLKLINVDSPSPKSKKSSTTQPKSSSSAIPMIIDTDMMTDCDDSGALAVAHALDHKGEIKLIGVIVSTHDYNKKHCNVVSAINTYYGKPNIPIGLVEAATGPYKDWNIVRTAHCPYSKEIYAKFPHDGISNRKRHDSNVIYRQLLHRAADKSVVIVVIGHLNAVANLLKSTGDNIDSRNGVDLIAAKVKKIVIVGFNDMFNSFTSKSMNTTGHSGVDAVDVATQYWSKHWPDSVEVAINAGSIGNKIITGPLYKGTNTPMEIAYKKCYNGINGRPSWDQTGVLYGARGNTFNGVTYWKIHKQGSIAVNMSGEAFARWHNSPNKKNQYYLIPNSGASDSELAKVISSLMDPSWVN